MTPQEIGKFTHTTIVPILERAKKKLEASGISTQLKTPHGDAINDGNNVYATDIGQVLYAIPSERMIKVEVVPEQNTVVVSTEDNLLGDCAPLVDIDVDALAARVDRAVDAIISKE